MTYYQLIQIYFKIKDLNNPYIFCNNYNSKNVYERLYWENKKNNYSCCSKHINFIDLKSIMKKKLNRSNYQKRLYKRACEFFYKINSLVKIHYEIYSIKKIKIKSNFYDWNYIEINFTIDKKGKFINDLNIYKYK